MTQSEVQLLQRELHALSSRNAADHVAVREALAEVRSDVGRVYERLSELERGTHGHLASDAAVAEFKRTVRGWLAVAAAIGGAVTGLIVLLTGVL